MYRLWGKIMKNNEMIDDQVFESTESHLDSDEKLKQGVEALCYHFDLQRPMWFADNTDGIKKIGKTQFLNHHFIENITFDYFEIEVIEDTD